MNIMNGYDGDAFRQVFNEVAKSQSDYQVESARTVLVAERLKQQSVILLSATMNGEKSTEQQKNAADIVTRLISEQIKASRTVNSLFESIFERYEKEIQDAGLS